MTPSPVFCYVILAHTDPEGLLRLVARIRTLSPHAAIVVRHEDPDLVGPSNLDPYRAIDLVSRIKVRWGSWTMVQAVLEAYTLALARSDADYFTLVSGQDYPVRELASWEQAIAADGVEAILDPMPAQPLTYRRHFFTFVLPGPRSIVKRGIHWGMDRIGKATYPHIQLYRQERTGPNQWWFTMPRRGSEVAPEWFVKASQWTTLRRDVLAEVLRVAGPDGRGLRRARTLLVPDEIAIQSLVAAVAGRIVAAPTSALRFPPEASSPDWLTAELVRELSQTTPAPFVRKVPVQGWQPVIAAADAAAAEDACRTATRGIDSRAIVTHRELRAHALGQQAAAEQARGAGGPAKRSRVAGAQQGRPGGPRR